MQTRILVTHALHVLPHVDQVMVLEDGGITEMGSYQELLHRKGALVALLEAARQPGGGGDRGTGWDLLILCTSSCCPRRRLQCPLAGTRAP